MQRHHLRNALVIGISLGAVATLYACSSDDDGGSSPPVEVDSGTDAGADTGTHDAGTHDASTEDAESDAAAEDAGDSGDTGVDAAVPVRCTQAEFDQAADPETGGDYTAVNAVQINFPTEAAPAQYKNRCVKVKVGTNVTFMGNFDSHPLEPNGGDTPTPIPSHPSVPSGTLTIAMTTAGTFGFQCGVHPTMMFGAIEVVP